MTAGDREGFIASLERELAADDPQRRAARSQRAREHSWQARLQEIADAIEAL